MIAWFCGLALGYKIAILLVLALIALYLIMFLVMAIAEIISFAKEMNSICKMTEEYNSDWMVYDRWEDTKL